MTNPTPTIETYEITSSTAIKVHAEDIAAIKKYGSWVRYGRKGDLVPRDSIGNGGAPRLRTLIALQAGLIKSLKDDRVVYPINGNVFDYTRDNIGVRDRIQSRPRQLEDPKSIAVKIDAGDRDFLKTLPGGISHNIRTAIAMLRDSREVG